MIYISQTITYLHVVHSLYRWVNLIFCIPKWDTKYHLLVNKDEGISISTTLNTKYY